MAEEEEARAREELEAAQELSRQLTQQDTIRKLKAAFDAIPEPEAAPTISAVRFQLPSGKKLSRRFAKTETVQVELESIIDDVLCATICPACLVAFPRCNSFPLRLSLHCSACTTTSR